MKGPVSIALKTNDLPHSEKLYEHSLSGVTKKEEVKLLCYFSIQTNHNIEGLILMFVKNGTARS